MPRKAAVDESIYMDEAEGFLLEHALMPLPRAWPPLPSDRSKSARLTSTRKRMDWEDEVRNHPDEPVDIPARKDLVDEDANKERCVICLMALRDRTIVGVCGHEFCFECIGVWANQSRRCPLCSADMAPFLLHDLDDATPTKFYLPPLPQRKPPSLSVPGPSRHNQRMLEERWGERPKAELEELDMQVDRRREIYRYELYVKHIASNPTTRFRPNPTPRQIADDAVLVQRATAFMRRELRVWSLVDVEFLTTYILSLVKAIDVRSEPAVRLLAEFLDTPDGPGYTHGAEHFAHELYSFLRSPYKELRRYDEVAQYDPIPKDRSDRSLSPLSSLRSRSRSRSPSRISRSRSPVSRPPSPPRDPRVRDTFIAPPSPSSKRWNEADVWLDPEYQAWLEEDKRRADERASRRKARRIPKPEAKESEKPVKAIELLPSPPLAPLRMDDDIGIGKVPDDAGLTVLSIRGASKVEPVPAPTTPRLSLLERLAKAKAEAPTLTPLTPISPLDGVSPLQHTPSDATGVSLKSPDVRAVVQARLRLRLKLASERKVFVYNQNESKAQELRRQLLEVRARREAEETDAVLRKMDRVDRAREVRRRLMVVKMMAAETESERRERELKERLMGERRARVLRETLRQRRESHGEGAVAIPVSS